MPLAGILFERCIRKVRRRLERNDRGVIPNPILAGVQPGAHASLSSRSLSKSCYTNASASWTDTGRSHLYSSRRRCLELTKNISPLSDISQSKPGFSSTDR